MSNYLQNTTVLYKMDLKISCYFLLPFYLQLIVFLKNLNISLPYFMKAG